MVARPRTPGTIVLTWGEKAEAGRGCATRSAWDSRAWQTSDSCLAGPVAAIFPTMVLGPPSAYGFCLVSSVHDAMRFAADEWM